MSPTSSRPRLTLELPKDVGSDMLDMKLNDCAPVRNNFLGAVGPLQAFIYIYIYIYCSIYIYIHIIKGSLVANFRYTNFWVAGQE